MLKGSREGVLTGIQPISVHGQLSLDVHFVFCEDSTQQPQVARLGPEAVEAGLETGDRISVQYLLGVATAVSRAPKDR